MAFGPASQASVPVPVPETGGRQALRREILRLAWPAVLEMCLHMGVWMFDVAMVGRLGAEALSATAVSGQVYWSLMLLVGGIGVALTAMVSRRGPGWRSVLSSGWPRRASSPSPAWVQASRPSA